MNKNLNVPSPIPASSGTDVVVADVIATPARAVVAGQRLKNPVHERYARLCLEYPQHEAFRRAMGKRLRTRKPNVLYMDASRVMARPEVRHRVAELRAVAAQTTALDLQERVSELRDIESADPTAVQYSGACRYCYSKTGSDPQWRDFAEYAEALQKALTEAKPLPNDAGGYDYDGSLHPSSSCRRCDGAGDHLYTADITRLPRREARLVKGFGKNGELLLHDQLAARAQLSKLLGLDRPDGRQIAREAAAAAAGAAIGSSVAAALTPEERMRAYLTMLKG